WETDRSFSVLRSSVRCDCRLRRKRRIRQRWRGRPRWRLPSRMGARMDRRQSRRDPVSAYDAISRCLQQGRDQGAVLHDRPSRRHRSAMARDKPPSRPLPGPYRDATRLTLEAIATDIKGLNLRMGSLRAGDYTMSQRNAWWQEAKVHMQEALNT